MIRNSEKRLIASISEQTMSENIGGFSQTKTTNVMCLQPFKYISFSESGKGDD